jgi:UDP-glucose 4-epimerase
MTKILLTGSSGTIGTRLAERLLDAGHDVVGVDSEPNPWSETVEDRTIVTDLTDEQNLDALPTDADMVVHFAANARVHRLVKRPVGARENIDMTFNMLEYARENDISKFIFSSSREVYGNKGKTIYSEEDTFADECESPYTASKVAGEALLDSYEQCYDIQSCILRFSNVYGKYDASDRVIPLFIAQAHRGEDLTVYGEDKVLDFTHVEDCVNGVFETIDNFHKVSGMTLNIASGDGTSLVELAETISDAVPTNVDVTVEPNRTGEVSRFVSDITRAQKILGYDPDYDFQEGIEATIDWYSDRQHLFETILDENS